MKKVLVANRGEIARRVFRTLKKMNIKSVAIYSEVDKNALHVKEADEAVYVGNSPASESYLLQDKIIKYCKELGVDGVHPGYGFLSENADFARKLKKEGIKLIGPSAESMEIMGDKLKAKQAVKQFNVPLVPGVDRAMKNVEDGLKVIFKDGHQNNIIDKMQTRKGLYELEHVDSEREVHCEVIKMRCGWNHFHCAIQKRKTIPKIRGKTEEPK